jgi:OOP family OmpA-OmpF porin
VAATTTTTVAAGPFDDFRAEFGSFDGASALLDFVESADGAALGVARLDDGRGVLLGRFDTDANARLAVDSCVERFGEGLCASAFEVGDAASASWLGSALASLDEVDGVPGWWIAVNDGEYTLRGRVASEETKDRIGAAVAAAIEPDLTLINELEVVDADVITGDTQTALEDLDLQGITFESGSAEITADGQAILDEAVAVLANAVGVTVEVGGHTDSAGGAASNQRLSQSRAESVVAYLIDGGVDEAILTAVGYGEEQPVADNATPEGREQNRRIEFTVSAA